MIKTLAIANYRSLLKLTVPLGRLNLITGANGSGLVFPGLCLLIGPDGNIAYKSLEDKEGVHIIHIDKQMLNEVRSHKMKYFLPNRRNDIFLMLEERK